MISFGYGWLVCVPSVGGCRGRQPRLRLQMGEWCHGEILIWQEGHVLWHQVDVMQMWQMVWQEVLTGECGWMLLNGMFEWMWLKV